MTTERVEIVITEQGGETVKRSLKDIGSGAVQSQGQVDLLSKAFRGLVGLLGARELIRINDVYTNMSNRLKLVAGDTANLSRLTKELFSVANSTRTTFEATATLYARVALSTKQLGYSQRELIDFVKGVNQAVVLSGVSAQEAQAAMIQFSQGLAKGRLDGEELRSVLEQIPYVADVIANKLKINRFELREWGKQGKLTPKVIIEAFEDMNGKLTTMFAKLAPTFSQAWAVIQNRIMQSLGPASEQIGQGLAMGLAHVADNMDLVVAGATALIPLMVVLAGKTVIGAVITSLDLLRLAMLRNPITAIPTLIAGAIVAFGQLTTTMDTTLEAMGRQVTFIDKLIATWAGAKAYIQTAWADFPAWLARLTIDAINYAIQNVAKFAQMVGQTFADFFGFEVQKSDISQYLIPMPEGLKAGAEDAGIAFMDAYSETLLERSRDLGILLPSGPNTFDPSSLDKDKKRKTKTFAQVVNELQREIDLMARMGREREKLLEMARIEDEIKRKLTVTEGELLESMLDTIQVLERQGELYDEIIGPSENFKLSVKALDELFRDGHVNIDQYNNKLRELQIGLLETDQTMQGGFLRGILKAQDEFNNLSNISENLVVNGLKELEDAFVELGRTGKVSFKSMVDSILSDVIRLNVRQNITKPLSNAFGEAFGFSGGDQSDRNGGGGGGGSSNLSNSFSSGGSLGQGATWLGEKTGSQMISNFAAGFSGTMGASAVAAGNAAAVAGGDAIGAMIASHTASTGTMAGAVGAGAAAAIPYIGALYAASQGQYGTAAGMAIGTYILPGIGTAIGAVAGSLFDSMGSGPPKTRHGQRSTTEYSGDGFNLTAFDDRQSGESQEAARLLVEQTVKGANKLFADLGVNAAIDSFYAIMESSILGDRQGVASGGTVRSSDGTSSNIGIRKTSDMTFAGFGGWSEADMMPRLIADMQMSVLEAFQIKINELPTILGDMLRGVDIRGLGVEEVAALIQAFDATITQVQLLREVLNELPFESLREMSFNAAASLIQFMGGLDNVRNGLSSYFETFYSEQEQLDFRLTQLTEAFASVGLTLPDLTMGAQAAKASFRALFESLDPETQTSTIGFLLSVNQEFANLAVGLEELNTVASDSSSIMQQRANLEGQLLQIQGNTVELRRRELETIHESNHGLQQYLWLLQDQQTTWDKVVAAGEVAFNTLSRAVSAEKTRLQKEAESIGKALRDSIATASSTINQLTSLSGKLESTIDSIIGKVLSEDRNQTWARSQLDRALATARSSGALPIDDEAFESALQTVSKPSEGLFDSFQDYQAEFLSTAHVVNELNEITGTQLSTEKRTLKALEDQLAASEQWYQDEMLRLDMLLESERMQLDIANGSYQALLTIPQALDGIAAAIARIQLTPPPNTGGSTGGATGGGGYVPIPGAGIGSSAWTTDYLYANPDVLNAYNPAWGQSPEEWAAYHYETFGKNEGRTFARGGFYSGGMALVGEQGPELINFKDPGQVYTAGQTQSLLNGVMNGGQNNELVAIYRELIEIRQAYADSVRALNEISENTKKSADSGDRLANGEVQIPVNVQGVVGTVVLEDRTTA